jgi:parallel beta-helix repeat protein
MRTAVPVILFVLLLASPVLAGGGKDEAEAGSEAPAEEAEQIESAPIVVPEEKKSRRRGALTGQITDDSGSGLQGVEVSCIDAEGRVVARTTTDANGTYLFMNLQNGEYTIQVKYSGFASKKIELDDAGGLPPPPEGLVAFELTDDKLRTPVIRVQWDRARDATTYTYRCELFLEGSTDALLKYPDIMQNFCEFGGLMPDTGYTVHVYARNKAGYSAEPARRTIRTAAGRPEAPFGLGVTYARNNVVELVWDRIDSEELAGFILQIKMEDGKYRYYSRDGLKSSSAEAYLIEDIPGGLMTYRIDDVFGEDVPLLENSIPYSFRVFAVDRSGNRSRASNAAKGIVLEDTIPPQPPVNIVHEFVGSDLLRILWESGDRDVEKYRVYYGADRDRWDGVKVTSRRYCDLSINREMLDNGVIYIDVVAIDRAGNESGYRTVQRPASLTRGGEQTENIVLSSEHRFRDLSVAIRAVPSRALPSKKVDKKPPAGPRRYGYDILRRNKFVVGRNETAVLSGKILLPVNTLIMVKAGGTLQVRDAELSPEDKQWRGILYMDGSKGSLQDTSLAGARVGIEVRGSKGGVALKNVEIRGCEEYGLHILKSELLITGVELRENGTGIYAEESRITVRGGYFEKNTRGMLARSWNTVVEDSTFKGNGSGEGYGLRIYGSGRVLNSRFIDNFVGIVVERGVGNVLITGCKIQVSTVDGIVVDSPGVEIRRNVILGNGRHGIYIRGNANPTIAENDIFNNEGFAVTGGGQINFCYIAFNNGSIYIDDTEERGFPDNLFTSSSSGVVKQIHMVDYIGALSFEPVVQ